MKSTSYIEANARELLARCIHTINEARIIRTAEDFEFVETRRRKAGDRVWLFFKRRKDEDYADAKQRLDADCKDSFVYFMDYPSIFGYDTIGICRTLIDACVQVINGGGSTVMLSCEENAQLLSATDQFVHEDNISLAAMAYARQNTKPFTKSKDLKEV